MIFDINNQYVVRFSQYFVKIHQLYCRKSELKLLKLIRCLSIAVMFSGLYIFLPIFFPP